VTSGSSAGHTVVDASSAVAAPRTHLEGRELYVEEDLGDATSTLAGYGYEIRTEAPVTEFFGGVQSLEIDHDAGTVTGAADPRRDGDWDSTTR
jgi:gamma-glutamyltranspeptidase/glutathione hydrolase